MQNTPEARDHLSTVNWCHYFFDLQATCKQRTAVPLKPNIIARYCRIAELRYHHNQDVEIIKKIGKKLDLFGGIMMQRAIFYTFVHMSRS